MIPKMAYDFGSTKLTVHICQSEVHQNKSVSSMLDCTLGMHGLDSTLWLQCGNGIGVRELGGGMCGRMRADGWGEDGSTDEGTRGQSVWRE